MASIYDKTILSKKDLERLAELSELWQQSSDDKQKAQYHDAAQAIRKGYGYSGGEDGSEFEPLEQSVVSSALASASYRDAMEQAGALRREQYNRQAEKAEQDGNERLRQAYIKNMQQSLALPQYLKAQGFTGGVTESTAAALGNNYLKVRDDILQHVSDTKADIADMSAQSDAELSEAVAKAEYEAAVDRADKMSAAEQRDYDRAWQQKEFDYKTAQDAKEFDYRAAQDAKEFDYRAAQDAYQNEHQQKLFDYQAAQDAKEFDYQKQQDNYNKQWQQKLFEYQAKLDAYDRKYQRENDALDRQAAMNRVYASNAASAAKNAASAAAKAEENAKKEQKEKLDELKKNAWELLETGVYDHSFPSLLGFSAAILTEYAKNKLEGY